MPGSIPTISHTPSLRSTPENDPSLIKFSELHDVVVGEGAGIAVIVSATAGKAWASHRRWLGTIMVSDQTNGRVIVHHRANGIVVLNK